MGGTSDRSTAPDLFSAALSPSVYSTPSSLAATDADATAAPSLRHILPKDLPNAIKSLSDQDLDQLGATVLVEQQRRGSKLPSNENSQKRRVEEGFVALTPGKLNAVRAAFKAGLKPSQIARRFRISHSDVRKALTSDASSKKPT
jgi:hypothetical protein